MSALSFPAGHRPRYENFEIKAVSDETIREGGERAPFGADNHRKLRLIEAITGAGVTDIDVGSGLDEAAFVRNVLDAKHIMGRIPAAAQFSFNLTLKTWEPLIETLERDLPPEYRDEIYVSVGMIEIDSHNCLFERVVDRLRGIGVHRFRSSLLNAFSTTIDEQKYEHLGTQIERCRAQGIELIRINDSVGTLLPEATAVLAANLVHDNPDITFYLHGHNDYGIGTANSLMSVFHGFQMVEGGVAGVGNRAGLPEIESIAAVFARNSITVADGELNLDGLVRAAQLSEETYMAVPDPYRAISGFLVRNENAGIVNVPDYLGVTRDVDYFLNRIGLFPNYIRQILIESGVDADAVSDPGFLDAVYSHLATQMDEMYARKRVDYDALAAQIQDFYSDLVRLEHVQLAAMDVLGRRGLRTVAGATGPEERMSA
ncbi:MULTISPECIES: 2-isopropylmalate synthase [unclassified Gordonia (in: high G+C Gram-positive bacteria)]|uniref:2-isopropylmalate synthase n=1 Tax=unclassified Gordonia (in: high G+C Gram-positive bacteria) TaxID=2657482 RepID=UPI0009ADC0F2|nr:MULTISPECIES: 2-isopropylmalate synthase [unclassified Gordonia (in: high G+C Gram-positive bacteria)]MDF3281366.1 2-isopropylmalate synthase [Gordonia sp. N1V]OPX09996.1 2-isopropylmalate synthase [Gordonia sp. i37]